MPMHKRIVYEESISMRKKKYGFLSFLFDICLVALTGGLWLIWIFVREMRAR